MNTTTSTTIRRAAISAFLAAACFTLAVPAADAGPKPKPHHAAAAGCPIDVHDFAATLRAAGFTAQAANNAAQITNRECLKELTSRTAVTYTRHTALGHLAMDPCVGLDAALRDLESLTRTVGGHMYRRDGLYSAGSALARNLSVRRCVLGTAAGAVPR
jgi:hypothetical protein